jgi:3-hydroxyisobutyrate dehydrogenase
MADVEIVTPESSRVGWIGTGVMGSSMCAHLLAAGYSVTVSTRTRAKASALLEAGATWADAPADVATKSDVIFSMVGYPADVREVILGPHGALDSARPGAILIDMSTSEPALAVEIAERAELRGVHALDAPVSGGDVGARNATLSIMVGGQSEAFDAVRPALEVLGSTIVLQGGPGAGQHTKMMNQILIASNMVGVCEALLYAYRANLDLESVLASVSGGAAGSWSLSNLAPRMIANNMAPGFYVNHFVKDMGIALAEAGRMKLSLPGLALANQLYVALQAQDGGSDGTQSLILALASLSGFEWENRSGS